LAAVPELDGTAIRRRLDDARLYLCTDARTERGDLAEFVEAALAGGVDVVQLRHKPGGVPMEAYDELEALEIIGAACAAHGALLAVNDRADVAVAAGADILHLGQNDLPIEYARRVVGREMAIGRSTHDGWQMRGASTNEDTDYFCVGPCWETPTKPGRDAAGLHLVRSTASIDNVLRMPWFAIGGIDEERLDEVMASGAYRVVVVRAITEAEDPQAAATRLSNKLRGR
jgi:thiamine-phosphate pyrophosphorylase